MGDGKREFVTWNLQTHVDGHECKPVMYIVQGLYILLHLEEHVTRNRSRCDHNPFGAAVNPVGWESIKIKSDVISMGGGKGHNSGGGGNGEI